MVNESDIPQFSGRMRLTGQFPIMQPTLREPPRADRKQSSLLVKMMKSRMKSTPKRRASKSRSPRSGRSIQADDKAHFRHNNGAGTFY